MVNAVYYHSEKCEITLLLEMRKHGGKMYEASDKLIKAEVLL